MLKKFKTFKTFLENKNFNSNNAGNNIGDLDRSVVTVNRDGEYFKANDAGKVVPHDYKNDANAVGRSALQKLDDIIDHAESTGQQPFDPQFTFKSGPLKRGTGMDETEWRFLTDHQIIVDNGNGTGDFIINKDNFRKVYNAIMFTVARQLPPQFFKFS
jgi:hypothetical protein